MLITEKWRKKVLNMENILVEINEEIRERLPRTYEILKESNLTVHPFVYKVILTGSRGLAGNYREDSDIDLSLLVDRELLKIQDDDEETLKDILQVTLTYWTILLFILALISDIIRVNRYKYLYGKSDL